MRYVGWTFAWSGAIALLLLELGCAVRDGSGQHLVGGTGTGGGTGSGTGSPSDASSSGDVFAQYHFQWSEGDCSNKALKPETGWYGNQWWGWAIPPTQDTPSLAAWQRATATVGGHIATARRFGLSGFALQWKGRNQEPDLRSHRFEDDFLRDVFLPSVATEPQFRFLLTMDMDQWFDYHGYTRDPAFRPIDFDTPSVSRFPARPGAPGNPIREQFVADVEYLCANYADHPQYYKIDGKAVLFLYDYHAFTGSFGPALWSAVSRCRLAGVELYLVGDFVVAPGTVAGYEARKDTWAYAEKAQQVDAVSAFSPLFGLDPLPEDSTTRVLKNGRFDQALRNGAEIARQGATTEQPSGKPFFPVVVPQYFKVTRSAITCGTAQASSGSRSYPLSRLADGADVAATSRATLAGLWAKIRGIGPAPKVVFINSWNDPLEGTMVEPTVTGNPSGYVMGSDFLKEVQKYSTGR